MKKYIIALILLFIPAIHLYATDYASMDRTQLLYELLVAKKQLKSEMFLHRTTLQSLQASQLAQNRIAHEKNALVVQVGYLESEIGRLQNLVDRPYRTGDIELSLDFNAGSSLNFILSTKFNIYESLHFSLLCWVAHPDYMWHNNWDELPQFFAGVGIGYAWKWRLM